MELHVKKHDVPKGFFMYKIQKTAVVLLMIICSISLISCKKEKQDRLPDAKDLPVFYVDRVHTSEDLQVFIEFDRTLTDDSCYLWNSGWLYSLDYKTGDKQALCSKPGCGHDKSPEAERNGCDAWFPTGIISVIPFQNNLYVLCNGSNSTIAAYRCKEDGSDRMLCDEADMYPQGSVIYAAGNLFFPAASASYDAKGGLPEDTESFIGMFDLRAGVFKEASDRWGYEHQIVLQHFDGERLYFMWTVQTREYSSVEDYESDPPAVYSLYVDIKTGEIDSYADQGDEGFLCGNQYVFVRQVKKKKYRVFQKTLPDGEPVFLRDTKEYPGFFSISGQVLFLEDYSDWRKDIYPNSSTLNYITVLDMRKPVETGGYMTGIMKAEDYLNGIDEIIYDYYRFE